MSIDKAAVREVAGKLHDYAQAVSVHPLDTSKYPSDAKLERYSRELLGAIGEDPGPRRSSRADEPRDPFLADTFEELVDSLVLSVARGADVVAAKLRDFARSEP